jgi:choline dehydrogenase-like flavoprotein
MSADTQPSAAAAPFSCVKTDVAVIGSGPGGAVVSCLLAEAGRDVVLIEEGPLLPLDSCPAFSLQEMVQKYRNGGITVAMGKPKVAYVEGRCVGGGSEINSGLYHRTPPEILEEWRRDYHVEALSEEEMRPHFEACEKDVSVSYLQGPAPKASLKLHEGSQALGWKSLEVPRWFKYHSQGGCGSGVKQSMTQTFVPRALSAGCRLLAATRVLKLTRSGRKWQISGVRKDADGKSQRLEIEAAAVFVCAGSIQGPALLQRSGFRRNLGKTLRMHPSVKIVARFAEEVNRADMGVPVHQVKEFAPRFSFGCSISSPPYLNLAMLDHPGRLAADSDAWKQCAIYYAMTRGGVGSVRPLPFFRDPLVRYRLSGQERADLSDALAQLARCLFAAGAIALYPSATDAPCLTDPADLARLPALLPAAKLNLMTIHLVGSCPMGENRERTAVDSFGRVHGAEGLYVADGSMLCTAPGVNPQGTIMALARRCALRFLSKL